MASFKYLLFDLDGTLIDSSDGVIEAVNYSLEKMGQAPRRPEEIKPYIGYPLSQMYPGFTDAPLKELYQHFQVKAASSVVSSTTVLSGVGEVLEILSRRNFKMAIATTKIKRHTDGIIRKFGWEGFFDAAVGGDEVEQVKPAPDVFRLALRRLEGHVEQSLVVGDTVNDVLAAQEMNVKVAAIASPYGRHLEVRDLGPDYFLESLGGILELLDPESGVD